MKDVPWIDWYQSLATKSTPDRGRTCDLRFRKTAAGGLVMNHSASVFQALIAT